MKKILLIFFFLINISVLVKGQNYLYYSQYLFNGLAINPAYAGTQDFINVTGNLRKQWVGIEGAPCTQTISAHSPVMNDMFGVGLTVINDKVGVTNQQEFSINYSYKIRFVNQNLSFGFKGGFNSLNSKFDKLNLDDETDVEFYTNEKSIRPIFGLGAYLKGDNYYAGLSIPQLYNFFNNNSYNDYFSLQKLCFISGGYIFDLNEDFKIKPSALAKANFGNIFEMDFTGTLFYKDRYIFGASYKTLNAATLFFEIEFMPRCFFSYSYDIPTSRLFRYQYGSHEISVNVYIDKKEKSKVINPRYF